MNQQMMSFIRILALGRSLSRVTKLDEAIFIYNKASENYYFETQVNTEYYNLIGGSESYVRTIFDQDYQQLDYLDQEEERARKQLKETRNEVDKAKLKSELQSLRRKKMAHHINMSKIRSVPVNVQLSLKRGTGLVLVQLMRNFNINEEEFFAKQ